MKRAAWCQRCGQPYETPTRPTCECAGDPPVNPATGRRASNLDPDQQAYARRVRDLRFVKC